MDQIFGEACTGVAKPIVQHWFLIPAIKNSRHVKDAAAGLDLHCLQCNKAGFLMARLLNPFTANINKIILTVSILDWIFLQFLFQQGFTIVLLSFLEKRKAIKPDLLGGRPAPVRPLSFLDEPSNRWGIIWVFGAVTANILQVVLKAFDAKFPIWAKIFMVYLLCLETSVICYPLFSCMTTRHKLVGAIAGLLYSILWFIIQLYNTIEISSCFVGSKAITYFWVASVPEILCNLLVVVKFCHKLFKCIKKKKFKVKHTEIVKLCSSHHVKYVKTILLRESTQIDGYRQLNMKGRLAKFLRSVPGFRYPITILAAMFMASVMLFKIGIRCAKLGEALAEGYPEFEGVLTAANVIATVVTFLTGIKNIWVFLQNYRLHMLSLYKGDKSFIPETVTSQTPNVYMARGMRFLGTAIVGTFWGTLICYLIVFIPLALMFTVFKLLKELGKLHKLMTQFEWAIYPACMIVIFQIQTVLIGRFLIQPKLHKKDKFKPLAVNNRNVYDILAFFFVFLNASIGLFTFLKRILLGALMGLFLIPRMDRSLLIRGYEAMDKCYVNYIGMIMVDLTHNHPVMRVFCHVIKECAEITWYSRSVRNTAENPIYSSAATVHQIQPSRKENSVAKRRWLLAYTLLNNPGLVKDRRNSKTRKEVDVRDIEFTESSDDVTDDEEQFCLRQKWNALRRCQCKCPRNLSTNLMAVLVLLALAILYSGVPLLFEEISKASQ